MGKVKSWKNIKLSVLGQEVDGVISTDYKGKKELSYSLLPTPAKEITVNLGFDLISLRLDMIGMAKDGINMHPQEYMRHLGYTYLDSEPLSIGDCWMFQVTQIIEPLNKHLQKCDWKFE